MGSDQRKKLDLLLESRSAMETEIDFHHVHKRVTYKKWQNGTNKTQKFREL